MSGHRHHFAPLLQRTARSMLMSLLAGGVLAAATAWGIALVAPPVDVARGLTRTMAAPFAGTRGCDSADASEMVGFGYRCVEFRRTGAGSPRRCRLVTQIGWPRLLYQTTSRHVGDSKMPEHIREVPFDEHVEPESRLLVGGLVSGIVLWGAVALLFNALGGTARRGFGPSERLASALGLGVMLSYGSGVLALPAAHRLPEQGSSNEYADVASFRAAGPAVSMSFDAPEGTSFRALTVRWPWYQAVEYRFAHPMVLRLTDQYGETRVEAGWPWPSIDGAANLSPARIEPGDLRRVMAAPISGVGFVANTFAFGAVLWLPLELAGFVRRARRRGSGRCPACGHPTLENSTCPECGQAV